jgi:transcriptional regulator with XRE-family HTH domain
VQKCCRRVTMKTGASRLSLDAYSIGPKLRALRQQRSVTLSRLAAETGLSTALLSKLETNRMIPTLPTLVTVSRVFGVGLSFFFAEPTRHSVTITRRVQDISHERARKIFNAIPLNSSTDARLLAKVVEFPTGVVGTLTEAGTTLSCIIHILEGTLQLRVGNGAQEVLETGDCACLDSDMLISWSANGKSRCRALVVTPGS